MFSSNQIVLHSRSTAYPFILYLLCLFIISHSVAVFGSVLGNDFEKSAKVHCLKIDTNVALYGKEDGYRKFVPSHTILGARKTYQDGFQRQLHGVELNCAPGIRLIVTRALLIHKDISLLLSPYEFHCILMNDIPESLREVSTYIFSVCDP